AARNVACTGARPVAVTNCLNFASPERPEVMGDFAAAVAGLSAACRALGTPVTGGNVSFYNESDGRPGPPTPAGARARRNGPRPALDRAPEPPPQRLLVELAARGLLACAHDCSDGGLAVALVEAVLVSGVGATVTLPPVLDAPDLPPLAALVADTPSP